MALPGNLTTVLVTMDFTGAGGIGDGGTVSFAPPMDILDASGAAIISRTPAVATLVGGVGSITLPATDDTDMNPTGWGYTVTVALSGLSYTYSYTGVQVLSSYAPTIDLSAILPPGVVTPPSPNTYGVLATPNTWAGKQTYQQAANGPWANTRVSGDSQDRFDVDLNGKMSWGPGGSTAPDTTLQRTAAGQLSLNGSPINGGVDYRSVKDYGAKGDGVTVDTTAIQNALNAGVGTVYFPAGTYPATGLTVPTGVRLVGDGATASILSKTGNGTLLSFTGTTSPSSGSTHVRYCSVSDLGFNGNGFTGSVWQLYYCDNFYALNTQINGNGDVAVDCVEFWDSRFVNVSIVNCTGAVNSTTAPNVWIRNASAASGVGASTGNSNNIHFIGCRFEGSGTGALWIAQGTSNASNPNNFKIVSCKFEADAIQGGPLVQSDNTTKNVVIDDCNFQLGGFASGYSTAQTVISLFGGNHVLSNCSLGNSGTATISNGVFLHAVGGTSIAVTNVIGGYTTAPTTAHINFDATATGTYSVTNTPTAAGTQFGGTPPSLLFALPRNLLVGSNTALGDNGVGVIQHANAATAPTTNPSGGYTQYGVNGAPWIRDPNGVVSPGISPAEFSASPTGALAETFPRCLGSAATATQAIGATTGTVYMAAIWLPAGLTVTNLNWITGGTAANTPTHWWLGLANASRVQVAHTADQTSGAIAANTLVGKALTATYTTTYTGLYYLLLSVTAAANPTATGLPAPSANLNLTAPLLAGASATVQSAPGTDGTTVYAAPASAGGIPYMYLT